MPIHARLQCCRSLVKLSRDGPRTALLLHNGNSHGKLTSKCHARGPAHTRQASTNAASEPQLNPDGSKKEVVVILGSGWAGYAVARTLSPSKYSRVLISPRSHFAFTPLLASTAVGTLEFRTAIEPVRSLKLEGYLQAWASHIDFKNKTIRLEANEHGDMSAMTNREQIKGPEFDISYDKLVVAVGCYTQTFGIEGVNEHASFLRDVGDARSIRLKILQAFETAELPTTTEEERKKLLHFAIVGGGPTGVEFAAELNDLVRDDLSKLYPRLMDHVAITVYDIAPKVLPMFDKKLAAYATERFRRQGIRVKTQHHLTRIRREGSTLMLRIKEEPEEVGAGIVVWSTGLMQNPLVAAMAGHELEGVGKMAKDARTGGIVVDPYMRVQLEGPETTPQKGSDEDASANTKTLSDVYAIGDCAAVQGGSYPATAQVASQQAVYLARQLNRTTGLAEGKPFKFKNWGVMTYLGNWKAIHQSEADNLRGWAAWVLWRTAYLTRSMSIRNKIMIPVYWLVTWIFGRDISRF